MSEIQLIQLRLIKDSSRDGPRTLAVKIGTNTLLRALRAAVTSWRRNRVNKRIVSFSFENIVEIGHD